MLPIREMCIRDSIEDDGQTVLITERIIKIHTTATDKDGNKELEAGKKVTIIDTVTLESLEVGTQYKLVGWQMPFATMTNREWGQIGNNYLKSLFAIGFQGFLIMICVGIYATGGRTV